MARDFIGDAGIPSPITYRGTMTTDTLIAIITEHDQFVMLDERSLRLDDDSVAHVDVEYRDRGWRRETWERFDGDWIQVTDEQWTDAPTVDDATEAVIAAARALAESLGSSDEIEALRKALEQLDAAAAD